MTVKFGKGAKDYEILLRLKLGCGIRKYCSYNTLALLACSDVQCHVYAEKYNFVIICKALIFTSHVSNLVVTNYSSYPHQFLKVT